MITNLTKDNNNRDKDTRMAMKVLDILITRKMMENNIFNKEMNQTNNIHNLIINNHFNLHKIIINIKTNTNTQTTTITMVINQTITLTKAMEMVI